MRHSAVYTHPRPRPGPRRLAHPKTSPPARPRPQMHQPIPCGPSSATPPAASSPWPLPAPPSAMLPPTAPPTMPCWPPCPTYAQLQRRLNRALQGDLPHALRRHRQPLAIDLTLMPYHGKPLHQPDEIYRSQAKSGTSHFHAYATAYVIRKGRRFTVALTTVGRHDALPVVLKRLLREAARAGVRPRYLLLDRGFCSVDVIRYLQNARYAWLMPLVLRGRKADHPKGPSGSRVFAGRKRSGWAAVHDDQRRQTSGAVPRCVSSVATGGASVDGMVVRRWSMPSVGRCVRRRIRG